VLIEINERTTLATEYRRLANGKYMGIVVERSVGRFSTDDFEYACADERNTKEEAFSDAKQLVQKYSEKASSAIAYAPPTVSHIPTEVADFVQEVALTS
jgi:hypothetical protein